MMGEIGIMILMMEEKKKSKRRHPDHEHETVGLKQNSGSAENRVAREWLLCQTATTTTRTIASQAQPDSLTHLLDRHGYHSHTPFASVSLQLLSVSRITQSHAYLIQTFMFMPLAG